MLELSEQNSEEHIPVGTETDSGGDDHTHTNDHGGSGHILTDGIHQTPDGAHHAPDGAHHAPDCAHHAPDGAHQAPDGAHQAPDGAHHAPDGAHNTPDGARPTTEPEGHLVTIACESTGETTCTPSVADTHSDPPSAGGAEGCQGTILPNVM